MTERTREELAEWGIEHGGMMLREILEADQRMVSPEVQALAEFAVEAARRLREMPDGERIEGWASAIINNPGWMCYDGQHAKGLAEDDVAHGDAIEFGRCTLILHPQEPVKLVDLPRKPPRVSLSDFPDDDVEIDPDPQEPTAQKRTNDPVSSEEVESDE